MASRAETQAGTKAKLLRAAAREFAAKGFAGASLDRIAEAAGFTRGAVYSNFADKADLFVAVLEDRLDRRAAEIGELIASGRELRSLRQASPRARREWLLLYDEFRLYALRNPSARRRLARHEQRLREAMAAGAAAVLRQAGVDDTDERFPPALVGAVLLALDHDLPRQQAVDPPHVPAGTFFDALALLLDLAARKV